MKNNLLYLFIILIFNACSLGKKKNLQNQAFIYTESTTRAQPLFKIYHNSNNESTLFFKVKSSELLSVFSPNEKQNKINYSISGKLFLAENERVVIDSFALQKSRIDTIKWIEENFSFSSNLHEHYLLKIDFIDENKIEKITKTIYFEKENDSKENFQLVKQQKMQFITSFNIGDTLFIKHNTTKKNLFVRYFKEEFIASPTPFAIGAINSNKINPKDIFTLTTDTTFFILLLNQEGIYQITESETTDKGLNILSFKNDFPVITAANEMVAPLQYISTKEEMQDVSLAKNTKIAMDQFWLSKAKNDQQKARKLIRTYYKRVENANRFFTSYKEGWKTDRGMIMIIFGAPNIIYQSEQGESWIYGEKNNMNALNFTFTKIENTFTDNDYQLNRSVYFKNIWNTAQNAWRNGYAYSDMDIKEKIYEQEKRQRQSQLYFWY